MINENLIAKTKEIKGKKDLFKIIGKLLYEDGAITNINKIVRDLEKRENQGNTAFENGLMIPHAITSSVKKIKLVIVEFNDNNFNSLDNKSTNFAVCILIPKDAKDEHLEILSKLSKLFSTKNNLDKFKKLSTAKKVLEINSIFAAKNMEEIKDVGNYDFVAITSCVAGVAHTYMARDAIIEGAGKLNLTCKVETRGAITENKLKRSEIDEAKFVLIAADLKISRKPFIGKKIHIVGTNAVIKNATNVIKNALNQKVVYGKGQKVGKLKMGETNSDKQNVIIKSIMYALSFMIPIAIVGGLIMAIPNALAGGGNSSGGTWQFPNQFSNALWDFGKLGLVLMVPILAMYIAYKIGGKPAMPAALLGGFFINDGALMTKYSLIDLPKAIVSGGDVSAGFLGGLVVGIFVGYLVKYMRWINWHKFIRPVAPLMIVPLISSFITFIVVLYVIGSPMTWVMAELFRGLSAIDAAGIWASMGVGMLFAGLMAIDLGGPINKTTLVVATVIFISTLGAGNPNFIPLTAVEAAISIPPLGMWLATVIFKRKFSITEKAAGQAALPMGLVGITEGSLPFAFKTPLKAIAANVSGAVLAGGLVSLFKIRFYGGLGSPLAPYIGYVEHSFYGLLWILSVCAGVILTALIYGMLRKTVPEYEEIHNKNMKIKHEEYIKKGLDSKWKRIKSNTSNAVPNIVKILNPKSWFKKPEEWDDEE